MGQYGRPNLALAGLLVKTDDDNRLGPADCIRIDEVATALKKMKKHKAPGLSGLVAEMIQTTGDIGTEWILHLCNRIVKEGCIPEDWKSSVVLPIYKGKGDPMECGSFRGIKLLEHATKVVERIFEDRIQQQIDIDDMQFGFMKGKGTTDAILLYDRCSRSLELKERSSILALWIWKKTFDRVPREVIR